MRLSSFFLLSCLLFLITCSKKNEALPSPSYQRLFTPNGGTINFHHWVQRGLDSILLDIEYAKGQVEKNTPVSCYERQLYHFERLNQYEGITDYLDRTHISQQYNDTAYSFSLGNGVRAFLLDNVYQFETDAVLDIPLKVTIHGVPRFHNYPDRIKIGSTANPSLMACVFNAKNSVNPIEFITDSEYNANSYQLTFTLPSLSSPFGICYIDSFASSRKDSIYVQFTDSTWFNFNGSLREYSKEFINPKWLGLIPNHPYGYDWGYQTYVNNIGLDANGIFEYNQTDVEIMFNTLAPGTYDENFFIIYIGAYKSATTQQVGLRWCNYIPGSYTVEVVDFGNIGEQIRAKFKGYLVSNDEYAFKLYIDGWFSFTRTR